jgi:hypothetical protein
MAQFIHLFDEANANSIRRGGIRAAKSKWRKVSGVFLFPLTENFVINHQWMRELRRRRGQTLLAARVRLSDSESVLLGKYNEDHIEVSAAQAVGILREPQLLLWSCVSTLLVLPIVMSQLLVALALPIPLAALGAWLQQAR